MSGSMERSVYVGHEAQHMRGVLTLHYPMRNSIVSNWDQMEMVRVFFKKIFLHLFLVCTGVLCLASRWSTAFNPVF